MSEADDPANKEGNVSESVEVSSVHSAGTSAPMVDLHACGICFQLYDESERLPKVLSCGHTNCLTCLNSWVKHSSSPFPVCSICRRVTRKPVNLLATNFQLLQVLRRMKLISAESKEATSDEQQHNTNAADNDATALNLAAVCEQVDEHMQEVASLLEIQMEALNMNEQQNSNDQGLLCRMIENSVADLLSRWDSAKTYLLDAEKRKTDSSSSRESLSMSAAFSEISAVIYDALHDETPGLLDFMPFRVPSLDDARVPPSESSRFDGIYDWGGESETLTHAYSDFSLFGSESHETAVSASQSSSQEETFPNFVGWEESPTFPHISTFHGPFASYSRCSLCQCRLSTSFASHQTHVSGRRHQQFIGSLTDGNSSGRGRRRPQSAAALGPAHTPNPNNRSFHASATAASTRPTEAVNLSLPSARRSLPHGTADQRPHLQADSVPRYGRNNRRNGRPPLREEQPNQNQSNRNNRGARSGNDANRRNNTRNTHRRPQTAASNRQAPASGWDNQEWPVIGWGQLPYEYVPGWSFGYGGYIQ